MLFGKFLVVIHLLALAGVAISGMSWPLRILLMLMVGGAWQFHQRQTGARGGLLVRRLGSVNRTDGPSGLMAHHGPGLACSGPVYPHSI
ncbi:MAG: hypothetical protein DSY87_07960 [Methylococcus sp.]|nr:MAG: hypothetical protein DSY87_07960 [Methylococcus sp.]